MLHESKAAAPTRSGSRSLLGRATVAIRSRQPPLLNMTSWQVRLNETVLHYISAFRGRLYAQ